MSHIALNLLAEKRSSTGGDLSAAGGPDNVVGTYMGYPKGASRPLGIAGNAGIGIPPLPRDCIAW